MAGVFTSTESAAIACVYALIITFAVYHEISIREMIPIMKRSIKTLAMVMALIGISSAFGWVVSYLQIPAKMSGLLLSISSNKIIILLIINLMLLILGTMMDMICSILLVTPILLPVVTALGIGPIQLGIIMILNLGIGLITPPVGVLLFVCSATSKRSIEQLTKAMLPH
ncbi:TRAP transporter large permease subunit [Marasmitruncus massiliensis]|uniref:TRAP transporter large permease subunit n=1 Tax=Marasmitruncus massiliensis TaxID=1944642 RepID=UPI001FA90D6F|nr:TRAP transporter large permease subunit [Marasmitruncus massiliensis]